MPVSFRMGGETLEGHIVSGSERHIRVITPDGREYSVRKGRVGPSENLGPKRTLSDGECQSLMFVPGDRVDFTFKRERKSGFVLQTKKRQARVCSTRDGWLSVAYSKMQLTHGRQAIAHRLEKFRRTTDLAASLLDEHGLTDWSFDIDRATSRLGACHHFQRAILLSNSHCIKTNAENIRDGILHEIAHALVGPRHYHDQVWRSKALEIGCSARVTNKMCLECGKFRKTQRKRNNCARTNCGYDVNFRDYSHELSKLFGLGLGDDRL